MAPEQARGRAVDARADIFALGAVLYEMLAGRRAFRGATPVETLSAILTEDPLESAATLPANLQRLLRRCLEKEPERRFGSARDLVFALDDLGETQQAAGARRRSVAVLPFRALSRDEAVEHLGLGLADATITELALLRSLVTRPTSAILKYEGQHVDPRDAGRELGVEAIVAGSFQSSGTRVRVTVQLVDVADGRPLWGAKIDSALDDVFRMQDEVSRKIAEALKVELSPADEKRLAAAARPGGRAGELFMKGRLHLFRDTLEDTNAAIDLLERATSEDPRLAVAWAGLADAYERLAFSYEPNADWHERAEAAAARALALEPELPEARYVKARLAWTPKRGFDHATTIRELLAAIAGRPSLNEAHHRLGVVLQHVSMIEEGVRESQEALAIDPADEIAFMHVGLGAYLAGRFEESLPVAEACVEKMSSPWAYRDYALSLLQLGRVERAAEVAEAASRRFPGDALLHSVRGVVAARAGDERRARLQLEISAQQTTTVGHYHHAQYEMASTHALLGEKDEAMVLLAAAARNGFPCHVFFELDPLIASLRPDPRFQTLMGELKRECDGYRALYERLRAAPSSPPA
jgi:TolB-like protein